MRKAAYYTFAAIAVVFVVFSVLDIPFTIVGAIEPADAALDFLAAAAAGVVAWAFKPEE